MKTIWKFPIPLDLFAHPQAKDREFLLKMPWDSRVVHVGLQNNAPMIWAEVDPNQAVIEHLFAIRATGVQYGEDDSLRYLGTISFAGVDRVAHLFG